MTDAKIDMLHQSGLFGSPAKRPAVALPNLLEDEQEEEDVEKSLVSILHVRVDFR